MLRVEGCFGSGSREENDILINGFKLFSGVYVQSRPSSQEPGLKGRLCQAPGLPLSWAWQPFSRLPGESTPGKWHPRAALSS